MSPVVFFGPFAGSFRRFVDLKQASGSSYRDQARLLLRLDRFLAEHLRPGMRLEAGLLQRFVASTGHLSPRGRGNVLSVAWQALHHARRHGADVDPLPDRPRFPVPTARRPYIYTPEEVDRILVAALRLGPAGSLRPYTYATLFALLYVTGLRVGEARRLKIADLDLGDALLLVREGKFRKSRLVPLSQTSVEGLQRYLRRRRGAGIRRDREAPFFPSLRGTPLPHQAIHRAFLQVLGAAGGFADRRPERPRIHDFRHAFAVGRVLTWYRAGIDLNVRLKALSTYLGHSHLRHTQVYLQPTEAMLREALWRFERSCGSSLVASTEVTHERA